MPRLPEPISATAMREAAREIAADEIARRAPALAAIARVRAHHVRSDRPVVTHYLCVKHSWRPGPWPERDEIDACPDCTVTERYACQHCRHSCPDDDEWPCATIRALETSGA